MLEALRVAAHYLGDAGGGGSEASGSGWSFAVVKAAQVEITGFKSECPGFKPQFYFLGHGLRQVTGLLEPRVLLCTLSTARGRL